MTERIKTPFGFSSTAEDVVQGIDLTGKHAIVTGGSSGIGIETARALAKAGANTTLAVRRPDAGEQVAADIRMSTGNPNVRVARLDLGDQSSVRQFVPSWPRRCENFRGVIWHRNLDQRAKKGLKRGVVSEKCLRTDVPVDCTSVRIGLLVFLGCDEINLLHSEGPRVYKMRIGQIKTEILAYRIQLNQKRCGKDRPCQLGARDEIEGRIDTCCEKASASRSFMPLGF